eukprot:scaffold1188_cov255-Pinguiococcus_pyrenoidosus.AAC.13
MPRPATVTSRSLSDAALRWIVRPSECSIWRSCVSPRSVESFCRPVMQGIRRRPFGAPRSELARQMRRPSQLSCSCSTRSFHMPLEQALRVLEIVRKLVPLRILLQEAVVLLAGPLLQQLRLDERPLLFALRQQILRRSRQALGQAGAELLEALLLSGRQNLQRGARGVLCQVVAGALGQAGRRLRGPISHLIAHLQVSRMLMNQFPDLLQNCPSYLLDALVDVVFVPQKPRQNETVEDLSGALEARQHEPHDRQHFQLQEERQRGAQAVF